jgi:hypothetical protein
MAGRDERKPLSGSQGRGSVPGFAGATDEPT